MAAMPMYGKNLKNLPLQNQLTDGLEIWGVASSMHVLQRYLNYDRDPFYANVKGQGSRRVKIGPVTEINGIWLYCMCMSSVTENDSF